MFKFLILVTCSAAEALVVASSLESAELLSELPVSKLLMKKKSVLSELLACNNSVHGHEENEPFAEALVRPLQHMQIRGLAADTRRTVHEEEDDEEEWEWMPMMPKGKGKIGKILDGSITALSFLAFAGYLLCLVVHVIKEKHGTETATSNLNANVQYQQSLLNGHLVPQTPFLNNFQIHGVPVRPIGG